MKITNASRRDVADGLLAGSLAVVGAIGLLAAMGSRLPDGAEPPNALAALLVAGQSLPIAWRRRTPLLVMAVVEVATVAYFLLHFPPTGAALGVLVAYYTVAARHPTRVMLPFAGGLAAAVLILTAQGRMSFQVFALLQVLFAAAWLMGGEQLTRREYTALVEDRAARLERELGYLAREAVADERVRITRELHETVADNVRAMAAQAKSAERSLPAAAAASRDTIGLIERTAEQTLSDLRRGLEVLDPADPVVAQRGSLPTMSQLSALVTEVKMAGLPVDLKIEGDAVPLPAEVDGSAYRIVQEALTSCLKRPGTARPLVVIRYGEEDLELQVTDAREGGAWQVDPGRGRYENLGWMQPRPTDQEAGHETWPEGSYGVLARLPLASVRP